MPVILSKALNTALPDTNGNPCYYNKKYVIAHLCIRCEQWLFYSINLLQLGGCLEDE